MTVQRTIKKGSPDDFAKVSQVSQFTHQERLQAYSFALSAGWHPLPFMQSLQSTFYRLCGSGDGWKTQPEGFGSRWFGRDKGAIDRVSRPRRDQSVVFKGVQALWLLPMHL